MKNKKIRRLCCVLMALCLLFSCFALPAFATGDFFSYFVTSVAANLVVDSLIRCLGVLPVDSGSGTFGTLVNECVGYVESVSDFIVNGLCLVTGVKMSPGVISYVPVAFAQLVWEWLPASGAVNEFELPSGAANIPGFIDAYNFAAQQAYSVLNEVNGSYYICYNGMSPFHVVDVNGTLYVKRVDNGTFNYWSSSSNSYNSSTQVISGTVSSFGVQGGIYTPATGLALGDYESPFDENGIPILLPDAPIYSPWTDHIYSIPSHAGSDEYVAGLPVSIPDSATSSQTQDQAQAGNNSIDWAETETGTDSVTLSSILSAVISLPTALFRTITSALSNFFSISGTADAYAISLTDFFPFCIPFDIYEFLSVLSAAPEAPVFHWVIPVPQLGRTFDIDIDLSPWDPVAAVFRTFELLAFIVGLGMITREKFLRS